MLCLYNCCINTNNGFPQHMYIVWKLYSEQFENLNSKAMYLITIC
jgi:hypothetical protein